MRISRAERSRVSDWAYTIDRPLLFSMLILIAIGLVLSLAASPAVALKKGLSTYYFFERHVVFAALGTALMLAISFLSPGGVRRLSLGLLAAGLTGMLIVVFWGAELNGAQRWLSIAGHSIQPSEFAKPAFVVMMAWLFSESIADHDMPALPAALGLWAVMVGLLVLQPDVGQTLLISATAGGLYVLAGLSLFGAGALAMLGGAGVWLAYKNFGHVTSRLDRFFSAVPYENYQVDRAMQSFAEGGFFGRGPGEGTIKSVLPDAHTDFIFAVVAEEYGIVACLVIVALYAYIVLRALLIAADEPRAANRLAIQGLAIIIGLQAVINIGVNTGLLPPKGMTLPFISSGGSSLLALSITAGMLLALTRWRADPGRISRPRIVPTVETRHTEERQRSS